MVFSPPSLSRDIKATKSNALPVLASLLSHTFFADFLQAEPVHEG
jgi:hypothetical protein